MSIRKYLVATALASVVMAVSPASAAVTYTFTQTDNQSFNFVLTTPDFVTTTQVFTPSDYVASSPNTGEAEFCVPNATCRTNSPPSSNAVINISGVTTTSAGGGYYFPTNAFTSFGVFRSSSSGVTGATLTVTQSVAAIPEPATWAMMLVGFGMVAVAARYRRRSVKVSLA